MSQSNDRTKMRAGETGQRRRFILLVALFFVAIFMFNWFTPMLSDDFSYGNQVKSAHGLGDLIAQEVHQYQTWTGRSVNHMLVRIFFSLPMPVFKLCNSLAFIVLSLIMYHLIDHKKKYDAMIYLLVQMGLWLFTVDFRQTVLWETGACNYLWGSTIILGFMALYRDLWKKEMEQENKNAAGKITSGASTNRVATILAAIGVFIFGTVAGWCNENTSGACLLFVLVLLVLLYRRSKKVSLPLILGAVGNAFGLFMMVRAPGNKFRASFAEENYDGLAGKIARFQKITLHVEESFGILLFLLIITTVVVVLQQIGKKQESESVWSFITTNAVTAPVRRALFYGCLFVITSYALIMTAETQPRAYFGAGLFLLIAILQNVRDLVNTEKEQKTSIVMRAFSYSAVGILALHFVFTYIDCGTQLFRIYRDTTERIAYIEEQVAQGSDDITVAKVHPAFYNKYSSIEEMELDEDPEFWTNVAVEEYYGVTAISAIPYDEWAASVGR